MEITKLAFSLMFDEMGKRSMPLIILQNCNADVSGKSIQISQDTTYVQVARSLGLKTMRHYGVVNSSNGIFIDLTQIGRNASQIYIPEFTTNIKIHPISQPDLKLPPTETYSVPMPQITLDNSCVLVVPSLSQNLIPHLLSGANLFVDGFLDEGPEAALGLLKAINSSIKEFEIIFSFSRSDLDFFKAFPNMPQIEDDVLCVFDLALRLGRVLAHHVSIVYRTADFSVIACGTVPDLLSIPNFEKLSNVNEPETLKSRAIFNAAFICSYAQSNDQGHSSLLLANAAEVNYLKNNVLPNRENMLEFAKLAQFKKSNSDLVVDATTRKRYIIMGRT